MILAKVFDTADIAPEMYGRLLEAGIVVIDGTGEYIVGYIAKEARACNDAECEEFYAGFDQWLVVNGASHGEKVLIHHGTFEQFPSYLFKSKQSGKA